MDGDTDKDCIVVVIDGLKALVRMNAYHVGPGAVSVAHQQVALPVKGCTLHSGGDHAGSDLYPWLGIDHREIFQVRGKLKTVHYCTTCLNYS